MLNCLKPALATLLSIFALSHTAPAIVIRADRRESDSLRLASRFPSAVLVGRGSGVLIAPDWVLTAAHVADSASHSALTITYRGRQYAVDRAYRPDDWRPGQGARDVGLLHLKQAIKRPVVSRIAALPLRFGHNVIIAGGGAFGTGITGATLSPGPHVIRAATNQVARIEGGVLAIIQFRKPPKGTNLEGIGAPGDSGGPMFAQRGGEWQVAAVGHGGEDTNHNHRLGDYGDESSYTLVFPNRAWISTTLAGKSRPVRPSLVKAVPSKNPLASQWVGAFNGGPQAMAKFVKEHFVKSDSSAQMNDSYQMFRSDLGALQLGAVMASLHRLEIYAKSSKRKIWIHFTMDLDPKGQIAGMRAMPGDLPPSDN